MASNCFELMMTKLIDIKEIFGRLKPDEFSKSMEQGVLLLMDSIINETANEYMPYVWKRLPNAVKDEIVVLADQESPKFLTAFMTDMQENVHEVMDLKFMCVTECVQNKQLLINIFKEVGEKEFIFIKHSGFYFGFLFGLLQMIIWFFYNGAFVLPVCGFIVGFATNWVALKVIFLPTEPIKLWGGYEILGLFLKRQEEVSETFARVNCVEIMNTKAIWESILNGPKRQNFFAMLRAHSIVFTENMVGGLRPVAITAMGPARFAAMKEDIATKIMEKLPTIIDQSYEYSTYALDMENTLCAKMQSLSKKEFERVLHPVFEEDEFTLVVVGAFLGALAGFLQMIILYTD
eukprot:CAMPEP_0194385048 /NCGR_PEP_ID=MMETSP0174-20130528/77834_1 /TAXON_ID=216777 /ORGANISM="Proboscia alata, Strain PI-D3" /LENGTH=347 /DNA_ID=CAMNT_0039172799 /DNA_START=262 /DNA_END=1305 /DNA_ORIENTATION=+